MFGYQSSSGSCACACASGTAFFRSSYAAPDTTWYFAQPFNCNDYDGTDYGQCFDLTELISSATDFDLTTIAWGQIHSSYWDSASYSSGSDLYTTGGLPPYNLVSMNDPCSVFQDAYGTGLGGALCSQIEITGFTYHFIYVMATLCNPEGRASTYTVTFLECCTGTATDTLTLNVPVPTVDSVGCVDNCSVGVGVFWDRGDYANMAAFVAAIADQFSGVGEVMAYGPDWNIDNVCPDADGDPFEGDP